MEEIVETGQDSGHREIVFNILKAEVASSFEELSDDDLHCGKYERDANEYQTEMLQDVIDQIWQSLEILCSNTDLEDLNLPYFDSKEKQNALKFSMADKTFNKKFLSGFVRRQWDELMKEKKRKKKPIEKDVQEILRAEISASFEGLVENDLYSGADYERYATVDQREMLRETVNLIWQSLEILCSTTLLDDLNLPYFNSKEKQDALKSSMNDNTINKVFLNKLVRHQWNETLNRKDTGINEEKPARKNPRSQKGRAATLLLRERRFGLPVITKKVVTDEDLDPHIVVFPSISTILDELVDKLNDPSFKVHKLKNLPKELRAFGSLQSFKDRVMKSILPEICDLQEQTVTRELSSLDNIFSRQRPLCDWPQAGGYLLYVTSTRYDQYWRPYVGQSFRLAHRIQEHVRAAIKGKTDKLCYWVLSKGSRELNFIRLWELSKEDGDSFGMIQSLNSILETLFCLCFESLPSPVLQRFLGPKDFSLRGLNVVPPLLQDLRLSLEERNMFRSWLEYSSSTESINFARSRETQVKDRKPSAFQPATATFSYQDINESFMKAMPTDLSILEDNGKASIQPLDASQQIASLSSLQCLVKDVLQKRYIPEDQWGVPCGSTKARIGFVLDCDAFAPQDTSTTHPLPAQFPKVLSLIGFNEENCLIWPFDFKLPFIPRKLNPSLFEDTILRDVNRQIIDSSALQLIVLCGPGAEQMTILPPFQMIQLKIRKMSFDMFLETRQSTVRRVYLRLTAPLSAIYTQHWRNSVKVSLSIKIAACLTGTQHISPHYFRTKLALATLVTARLDEQVGDREMTEDSIPESIWAWLHTHGFRPTDIPILTKLAGGSVSRGLLLAMVTAPYRPEGDKPKNPIPRCVPKVDQPRFNESFTKSQLEQARMMHTQRINVYKAKTVDCEPAEDFLETKDVSPDLQAVTVSLDTLVSDSSGGISDFLMKPESSTSVKLKYKATRDTVPASERGKGLICCWCEGPTYHETSYSCWNSLFVGSICQHCCMSYHNSHPLRKSKSLPIPKCRVLQFEIPCGFCGLQVGPDWKFMQSECLPACSVDCRKNIKDKIVGVQQQSIAQERKAVIEESWVRWQEQMPIKLRTTASLRKYFKERFGLDTTVEGLMRDRGNAVR